MELTSKQRAYLRGLASTADTVLYIGKEGITENVIAAANDALEARELIKGKVQDNALLTAREAADALQVPARAEVVQVIGSKFVLYRRQNEASRRRIELPERNGKRGRR